MLRLQDNKPPPAPSRRVVRIAFWGVDPISLAEAVQNHCEAQEGWCERLAMHAHLPRPDFTSLADEQTSTVWNDWLAHALQSSGKPHLSLLVPAGDAAQQVHELRLRSALSQAGIGFQVLYGASLRDRVLNAANAIALCARAELPSAENACFTLVDTTQPLHPRMRSWNCDKCSDPDCEHRLFTSLVAN
ncbi:hypothetical protein [Diaphorobacter sp.]|uniref:hypothetical protein n=1 Tax=Diaphorobacter sp. TaxID=1934310 RepID=UPI0028B12628|nr:hypothetical protein [Diaphorobacter sp.]